MKKSGKGTAKNHYTLTDIYEILDSIDKGSLIKITEGKLDKLDDEVNAKISEIERVAQVLGWDQKALSKAITLEIKKR